MPNHDQPYRPTKRCPHRWCPPLHFLVGALVLVIFLHDTMTNWRFVVVATPLAIASLLLYHLFHGVLHGKTPVESAMDDLAHTGTGGPRLVVRPVWANIAVGMDLSFFTVCAMFLGDIFSGDRPAVDIPAGGTLIAAFGVALTVLGFAKYAHYKATEPAKPRRVLALAQPEVG